MSFFGYNTGIVKSKFSEPEDLPQGKLAEEALAFRRVR